MLAFLDALLDAVEERQGDEVARLLAHPLAGILTRDAVREAKAIAAGGITAVPLRLLQLRHQTAQLLHDVPAVADQVAPRPAAAPLQVRPPARHRADRSIPA